MSKKPIFKDLSDEYSKIMQVVSTQVIGMMDLFAKAWSYKVMTESKNNLTHALHAYERVYFDIIEVMLDHINKERWNLILELIKDFNIDLPKEDITKLRELAGEAESREAKTGTERVENEGNKTKTPIVGDKYKSMYI